MFVIQRKAGLSLKRWEQLQWLTALNAGLISVAECNRRLKQQNDVDTSYVIFNTNTKRYVLCHR